MSGVAQLTVEDDEDGMRLDRWFAVHFPQLPFGRVQKLIRTGQVRVDKARAKTNMRLAAGQTVRVPPVDDAEPSQRAPRINSADADFLRGLIIYEDDDIYVFNKPAGLAVQGGSGTKRHIDGMLKSLPNRKGEAPRLVHRLDRDTSGCLLVAKTRSAASHFGSVFRSRSARKIYWAVVAGVPSPKQGRISCFLAKQATTDGEQMRVVGNGEDGAVHSVSYYSVTDTAGPRFAWVTLKPVTGRTHQLRVHMAELGTPIIGDPRYFNLPDWETPEGLGSGLHLHARRLSIPLPAGKRLDISAPLPPHMVRTFDALGFDASRYDAQSADPEDEE
ncbi:MAG TPA: RluA family pseudouridine synthase [Devosiaceae bacterium]